MGSKIKEFKVKDKVTREDIAEMRCRNGGAWVIYDAQWFLSKDFTYNNKDFKIEVAFRYDIQDWNVNDNVLITVNGVQKYKPFYDYYNGDLSNTDEELSFVIRNYNKFIHNIIFMEFAE